MEKIWIYCYDFKTKQQSTVSVHQNEPTVPLQNCRTMNSDWYMTISLPEVIDELRKNNCKRRITLHHSNASSDTAKQANKFLKEKNVKLMSNLAYSPNLTL
ncbi:hypothetical protein EVAR_53637_1 [Eumeta japonica]|uniref:Mariner Mos1 transposase n=1 Tax=Eumeta variegata TaxID=151549 RepID=A0A4C1X090_EUMVA|nr:hypothetical protein EVAR_53637_1 [Eumeta japonica]